jgi:integrase
VMGVLTIKPPCSTTPYEPHAGRSSHMAGRREGAQESARGTVSRACSGAESLPSPDRALRQGRGRRRRQRSGRCPAAPGSRPRGTLGAAETTAQGRPHSLRRTYASVRAACGDDPVYIAEQLGHEDPTFTIRVYARAAKRRERLADEYRTHFDQTLEWAEMGRIEPSGQIPARRAKAVGSGKPAH